MSKEKSLMMMPWFPRDFMSSTRGWSVTARGVYRELLDAQWDMGELPADPTDMQAVIGATDAEWMQAWPKVEAKFPLNCSGRKNPKLETHRQRASQYHEKRSEAGRKGNAKRWQSDRSVITNGSHPSPSPSPSPSPNQTDKSQRARFAPPILAQVEEYMREKGRPDQATRFHAYYESNGWKVGKNPMKNWQAAAAGWLSRETDSGKPVPKVYSGWSEHRDLVVGPPARQRVYDAAKASGMNFESQEQFDGYCSEVLRKMRA